MRPLDQPSRGHNVGPQRFLAENGKVAFKAPIHNGLNLARRNSDTYCIKLVLEKSFRTSRCRNVRAPCSIRCLLSALAQQNDDFDVRKQPKRRNVYINTKTEADDSNPE
jgi:hypothetical protein